MIVCPHRPVYGQWQSSMRRIGDFANMACAERILEKDDQMDIRLDRTAVKLNERETISVVDGKGARIAVVDGSVWITQEHDPRDVMLRPGESFTLDRNGTAVIEALADAEVALDAPSGCLQQVQARDRNLTSLAILGYARRQGERPHVALSAHRR